MKKSTYRLREVTFDIEVGGENIVVTARGYNKQSVTVSTPRDGSKNYSMNDTFLPILEYPKKALTGNVGITISVGSYDVLQITKNIFGGIKIAELESY